MTTGRINQVSVLLRICRLETGERGRSLICLRQRIGKTNPSRQWTDCLSNSAVAEESSTIVSISEIDLRHMNNNRHISLEPCLCQTLEPSDIAFICQIYYFYAYPITKNLTFHLYPFHTTFTLFFHSVITSAPELNTN